LEAGGVFGDIQHLVNGQRGREVYEGGDIEAGVWSVGLAQGLIHDIVSATELVPRIVAEAVEVIRERLAQLADSELVG
jgi:nitronate monooxygenase